MTSCSEYQEQTDKSAKSKEGTGAVNAHSDSVKTHVDVRLLIMN